MHRYRHVERDRQTEKGPGGGWGGGVETDRQREKDGLFDYCELLHLPLLHTTPYPAPMQFLVVVVVLFCF